jgi:hypothetical protein
MKELETLKGSTKWKGLDEVTLPCVMVQGHYWFLKIASLAGDVEVVCFGFLLPFFLP